MSDVTPTLTISTETAPLVSATSEVTTDAEGGAKVEVTLANGPVSASVVLTVSVSDAPVAPSA